nr:MAG: structural protein VP1 [Periparus ater ambidensovirus]
MSQDIELGPLLPVSASSSEETVFTRYGSSKVHRGYGASRIPIKPSASAGFAAGQTNQKIFEGHLGNAAADPKNPIGNWFHEQIYGKEDKEANRLLQDLYDQGKWIPQDELKPDSIPWNKDTRAKYPHHWKSYKREKKVPASTTNTNGGIVLPFSNNIGPGNSLQPARTRADFIAQGHDIHYQDAKKNSDVLSADREAIGQFVHEIINPENPVSQLQAAVGAFGLGVKHGIETLTGKVFYGKYVFTF